MLETIQGIPQRIASLRAKLAAREGKKEFKENCEAIRAEIARLEAASQTREALREFLEDEAGPAVASETGNAATLDDPGKVQ